MRNTCCLFISLKGCAERCLACWHHVLRMQITNHKIACATTLSLLSIGVMQDSSNIMFCFIHWASPSMHYASSVAHMHYCLLPMHPQRAAPKTITTDATAVPMSIRPTMTAATGNKAKKLPLEVATLAGTAVHT